MSETSDTNLTSEAQNTLEDRQNTEEPVVKTDIRDSSSAKITISQDINRPDTDGSTSPQMFAQASQFSIQGTSSFTSVGGSVYHVNPSVNLVLQHDPVASSSAMTASPSSRPASAPNQFVQQAEHESEVYARILMSKRYGYPLWDPQPPSNLHTEHWKSGIRIGDVGLITADGDFDFLFNICLPADHPINDNSVPENFQPITPEIQERHIKTDPIAWKPGSHISKGVRALEPRSITEFIGQYSFEGFASEGALLTLPEGATRVNLRSLASFCNYAGENAHSWYKYANDPQGPGRMAANGSLYLVTGFDKVKSWGTASFSRVLGDSAFNMSFVQSIASGGDTSLHNAAYFPFMWNETGCAATKEGPYLQSREIEEERPTNQTVFLRGFRVALPESIWASLMRKANVVSITDMDPAILLQKGGFVPFLGHPGWTGYFAFGSGSGTEGGRRHTDSLPETTGADALLMSNVAAPRVDLHPLYSINQRLLQDFPEAKVAVTHDDVWCSALDEEMFTSHERTEILKRINQSYLPVCANGVVTLTLKEAEDTKSEIEPIRSRIPIPADRSNPQDQLAHLLEGVSAPDFSGAKYSNVLDQTYIRILCAALSGHDEIDAGWLQDLNRVLGALVTLAKPLPYGALASLLGMNPDELEYTLSRMHALVAPSGNGADMTFRISHKSFPDFITNKERIQQALATWKSSTYPGLDSRLWINIIDQHLQLAKACFRIMDRKLKWNMADLDKQNLYKDKQDIPHIRPELIPRELAYAAMHWASHLRSALGLNEDLELQMYLDSWTSRHILSWMESMVILDEVDNIFGILEDAIESLCAARKFGTKQKVLDLLSDAYRFVKQGDKVIRISPMHIYSCMATGVVGRSTRWDPLLATLIGHSSRVNSVAFSGDGSRVASGSNDNTIRLWNARTGAHLSTLTGHSGWVFSVAFSRSEDGFRLASGSCDKTVRLWDASTGVHLSTLTGHSDWVNSVSFSADGSQVASGSYDKTVRLWDAITGAHLSTLTGHQAWVNSVVFSEDGSRLASGSGDNTIQLWDVSTGAHLSTLTGHSGWDVFSVAFSEDDSRLASGSYDKTVRLWDASTGVHLSTLTGHLDSVRSVAFSADGSQLASGSYDKTVRLWDTTTGAHLFSLLGHSDLVNSVVFSADGSRVASGSHDKTVRLWDAVTSTHLPTLTSHYSSVTSIAFSADGSRVASGSNDKTVRLWDATTGAHLSALIGHLDSVRSVAFSADGSRLASGSRDNTIRLWDASTGARLSSLLGHSDLVSSVTFSADGSRVASGSYDKTVRLWDATTGAHLSTLTGHSKSVESVAFSADSSRLASGSGDNTIRLWDASTGAYLSSLLGHSDLVNSVTFSADGSRVASGSYDNTVRLWDANTGAHLSHTTLPDSITSVLFLPNNYQMIDQVISPGSQPLGHRVTDYISLLLLVKRENPFITGIMMANIVMEKAWEKGNDSGWEVVWLPPDIRVRCLSVDHINPRMAIGCEDGRVMTLDSTLLVPTGISTVE